VGDGGEIDNKCLASHCPAKHHIPGKLVTLLGFEKVFLNFFKNHLYKFIDVTISSTILVAGKFADWKNLEIQV